MAKYLLSLHSVEGEAGPSMTDDEMHQYMGQIHVLEDEMKSAGAWVFGGALHGPDTATVVRVSNDEELLEVATKAKSLLKPVLGWILKNADQIEFPP